MAYDPMAVAAMVAYCGWDPTVPVSSVTVALDGDGTFLARLPSLYVTDVSAVVVTNPDGSTYAATVGTGTADVSWSENGVMLWQSCNNGGCFPEGQQNIAVTYSGGYTAVPADLDAALNHLSGRVAGMNGATSKRLGSASISYAQSVADGGLLLIEQMVFDSYRIPRVA